MIIIIYYKLINCSIDNSIVGYITIRRGVSNIWPMAKAWMQNFPTTVIIIINQPTSLFNASKILDDIYTNLYIHLFK